MFTSIAAMFGVSVTQIIPFLVAAIVAFFKGIKFVKEGENGIKLRFGKAVKQGSKPKIYFPGFTLLIPFADTLHRRHVRQQTIRFKQQKVLIQGNLVFIVSAVIFFRVNDVYKALFEIEDLDESVADLCLGQLKDILQEKNSDTIRNTANINEELLKKLKEKEVEWGVEFLEVKITDSSPAADARNILSVSTGVEMKMKALQDAAEKNGVQINDLPASIASALLGIPLVTAIPAEAPPTNEISGTHKRKKSFLDFDSE